MLFRRRRPTVRVTGLASTHEGGVHRVSAVVDGSPVWFESAHVALRAAPEAIATAFLVPALHRDARLELEGAVCPTWHANVTQLVRVFRRWWGTPTLAPVAELAAPDARGPAPATGLCFSGGVDSFHTLLRSAERKDLLVAVQGFDIALADSTRMSGLESTLSEVRSWLGTPYAVIRTNLREHPLMRAAVWERTHGGALAAIGHVLDGSVGRLLISSSIAINSPRESWGSHWKTDPLWSSSRLGVANIGSELRRTDKVRAIADEPLVQQHLRVCWENRAPKGNCSRCQKCLHAMLFLEEYGVLDRFPVFEGGEVLVQRLDALPRLRGYMRSFHQLAESDRLSAEVRRALRDLIGRTRDADSFPAKARRYLARALRSVTREAVR